MVVGIMALAGCGRGIPAASFDDAVESTQNTLRDLLLGPPPERTATLPTRPDPPLLRKGGYETVLIATDAEGFARISQGSVSVKDIQEMQRRVVEGLDKELKERGFSARGVSFGADVRGEEKALLATLIPTTQEGGSPRERAEGKGKTFILIRLTLTDPKTGAILRQRDYYSGHNVKRSGR